MRGYRSAGGFHPRRQVSMEKFDCVVVGSGFGGSVSALRLAQAGLKVCVLERGRLYPPNSFARSPYRTSRNFWDPKSGMLGLVNVWSFGYMDAIVSSGVGGGSLIYSNVMIRKDANWFTTQDEKGRCVWPFTRGALDPYYDRVEQMLCPDRFPASTEPYASVPRLVEYRRVATEVGFEATTYDQVDPTKRQWYLPNLAITFKDSRGNYLPGAHIEESVPNLHERDRETCRLCGECNIGCNYGSKNTLDYNYLTQADRAGAKIRPLAEVKVFEVDGEPSSPGFVVHYRQHQEGGASEHRSMRCRYLVLSAGTLGSTYLMLKMQKRGAFPNVSFPMLGRRFSSNGDLLMLAMRAQAAQGNQLRPLHIEPSYGPAIISTIRSPAESDGFGPGARGFYLQDAGYPAFVEWLVQATGVRQNLFRLMRFVYRRLFTKPLHLGADIDRDLSYLLGNTRVSTDTLALGAMGEDVADGIFSLDSRGRLALHSDDTRNKPLYAQMVDTAKTIAEKLKADFWEDPLAVHDRLITVHPLGGCSMGDDPDSGVVNEWGEVHGVPGLRILDGSVLPGPVGANPSLTIAAVAERSIEHMIKKPSGRRH
jgi:cholesterol oxidase